MKKKKKNKVKKKKSSKHMVRGIVCYLFQYYMYLCLLRFNNEHDV